MPVFRRLSRVQGSAGGSGQLWCVASWVLSNFAEVPKGELDLSFKSANSVMCMSLNLGQGAESTKRFI